MKQYIGGKEVNVSENEFNYFLSLIDKFTDEEKNINGEEYFIDLFDVDKNGFIVSITPKKSVPWAALFFVQQLMINQRLEMCDRYLEKIERLYREINEQR